MKILLVCCMIWLLPVGLFAQSPYESVDLKKIPQRSVRKLARKEQAKTSGDFRRIASACYLAEDSASYRTHLQTFNVKAPLAEVWKTYLGMTPNSAWKGRMVNFGFLFSKPDSSFIYPADANEPIHVGNIIFVNLRLLRGMKNLGVGFEVTRLDEACKTICFCYLQDGISNGSQEITFSELSEGETRISHLTHYRSHSPFRDKELYPVFHEKVIGEFHQNIIREIEKGL